MITRILFSLLTVSLGLMGSGSAVLAKGGSGAHQVKTSGTAAPQTANSARGLVVHRPKGCGHKTYGECAFPPAPGATSGGNSINRGPGHPALHPK